MESRKRGQMRTILALAILTLISALIAVAVNVAPYGSFIFRFNDSLNITLSGAVTSQNTIAQGFEINTSKIRNLTKLFNEDSLDFDREYRIKYLNERNNFSNLNFKNVVDRDVTAFTVGARNDNVKGFNVNNKNFAIDLIDCDSWERYCAFRINGVPTKKLFSFSEFGGNRKNSFDLDGNYILKINSIEFDFCDNRRFCHLGYEGYHVVDVSIEKKNGR